MVSAFSFVLRLLPLVVIVALIPCTGCSSHHDGWFERQGESMDRTADDVGDAIEDVGEDIQDEF